MNSNAGQEDAIAVLATSSLTPPATRCHARDGLSYVSTRPATRPDRIALAREIVEDATAALVHDPQSILTWTFSGLSLDGAALVKARAVWTELNFPILDLVDFGFNGTNPDGVDPTLVATRGLAWFVDQEIVCLVPSPDLRRACVLHVVQLAHAMLRDGPYTTDTVVPAPDLRGEATLRVRNGVVELIV